MKIGLTIPYLGNIPLPQWRQLAAEADAAGLDSVFNYEFYHDPFVGLASAAVATTRIQLGTAVAQAFTRSPFLTANAAADIDELSGGRFILGLGAGEPGWLASFHGLGEGPLIRLLPGPPYLASPPPVPNMLTRMREYLEALRASFAYLTTGTPTTYEGKFYRLNTPEFNVFGARSMVRDKIPMFLGALNPKMLQLAGEFADGNLGALYSPTYIRDVIRPNLEIGARRAGKDPGSPQVISLMICSVSKDRAEAVRRARIHVGSYISNPGFDRQAREAGLEKEQLRVREVMMAEGLQGLDHGTDDKLVEAFSITGTPDECREKVKRFEGVIDHMILHTPYVPPLSGEESEDAARGAIEAFAK